MKEEDDNYLRGLTKNYSCEEAIDAFENDSPLKKSQLLEFDRYSFFRTFESFVKKNI